MIRKLRIKFICVIMAIVMVLLGTILGVVIHFTHKSMEAQSISMMRAMASIPFDKGNPGLPPQETSRSAAFVVQINVQGDAFVVDKEGAFILSDEDYLRHVINQALTSDQESGELRGEGLRYLKSGSPMGITIVFMDISEESAARGELVRNCVIIYLSAMLVFLGITVTLSRWVIRPVEKAWNQQRQFVSDASHELKTPLSVIMANAELMQSEEAGEEDREKLSGNILTMTYQMRTLVENMLEMARVDNGTVKMQFTPLDFSQLITDAALSVQLLYEEKGLNLRWEIPEGICIQGSEHHLYQVMDVLLDNALKYSDPNGEVRVALTGSGRNCLLSVASPGEEISREDLKNIFKRFYRVDKARAINGSYGLGLPIAESIVLAHKGKIWAESEGGMNTFFVQLPLNG